MKKYTVQAHARTPPKGTKIFTWRAHAKKHREAATKKNPAAKKERGGQEVVVNFVGVECLGNDGRGAEGGFGVPRNFALCGFCNLLYMRRKAEET